MSAKTTIEDTLYERQIQEVNELGNALLAGIMIDKIAENKKKILNKVQNIGDLNTYKSEVDKLKSLEIAKIHKVLNVHEESELVVEMEAAERLLNKIEDILCLHVKHNAKDVISNDELERLKTHMNVLQSLKDSINKTPSNTAKSKLEKVEEFSSDLKQINEYIEVTMKKLIKSQLGTIRDGSDRMSFS